MGETVSWLTSEFVGDSASSGGADFGEAHTRAIAGQPTHSEVIMSRRQEVLIYESIG